MEAYKSLVAGRDPKRASTAKKGKRGSSEQIQNLFVDKLAETKKREAEIKAALKEVRENKKHAKQEEKAAAAHEVKIQRMKENPNSKRAQKDVRHLEQKGRRKSGQMCEHGIWKCKICFPVDREK